jgi:hypothetical protein
MRNWIIVAAGVGTLLLIAHNARVRYWLSFHAQHIAGVVAAVFTLFLMVNADTGAEAVACLITAPICFLMVMAIIGGLTD